MSDSPSKRQRISVDTFISRSNGDAASTAHSNPTTPTRRASYLSPTKASLARSHPKLLTKSPGRAATEPRNRRAVHGVRPASPGRGQEQDNLALVSTLQRPHEQQDNVVEPPEVPAASNALDLASAIAQAFKDAPLATERDNVDTVLPHFGRMPLSPRQPRHTSLGGRERPINDDEQAEPILPKLVKHSQPASQSQLRNNEEEVNLPPTPVQLGLSEAPYRPRGLASSSSGGSRSGTGKHRRRTRNNESRSITSSPLKPRERVEAPTHSTVGVVQEREEVADEAAESDIEGVIKSMQTNLSAEALQKQAELVELEAELASLRKDLESLELLSHRVSVDESAQFGDELQKLLDGNGQTFNAGQDSLGAHVSFVRDPKAFLELFAPANLDLTHSTTTKVVNKRPKIIHKLTFTASKPWLESSLKLTLDVSIDVENMGIESITQTKPGFFFKHDTLQQWIEARLADPIHRIDIAGLALGTGQYFEACIARATVFENLSSRHAQRKHSTVLNSDLGRPAPNSAIILSQYLDTNQLNLSMPFSPLALSKGDVGAERQMLLTYDLKLNWTGRVQTTVQITCTNIGPKAQKSAKDLFQRLMVAEGITNAFEGVWTAISTGDGGDHMFSKHQSQSRKARKKIVAV